MGACWKWFSAKMVFRIEVEGEPWATDADYDPTAVLIEERIILMRARSHEEALRIAEKDAAEYPGEPYLNPYGQRVVFRALDAIETFELYDEPASRVEIWSSTMLLREPISDDAIIEGRFGALEAAGAKRKRFLNQEFSGIVRPG